MNEAEWNRRTIEVKRRMAQYVRVFVTPICREADGGGFAWGTGNYVELRCKVYALTNEHVARRTTTESLGHLPNDDDEYRRFPNPWMAVPKPEDAAISRLDDGALSPSRKALVAATHFDSVCNPAENELFFVLGFPASTAGRHDAIVEHKLRQNRFDGPIETPAVPFLTQEFRDEEKSIVYADGPHIGIHYPTYANRDSAATQAELPNPGGMSGSLLWDTKYVARAQAKQPWSPQDARVCGLVCEASPDAILAVRIEQVRKQLLFLLCQEASYFRWHDAGCPAGSDVPDWLWAEAEVATL